MAEWSRISRISWIYWLVLIPLWTSCATPPSAPPKPQEPICRAWNRDELTGYYVLTQLAIEQREAGDEMHVAAAVEAMGALLTRCGILQPPDPD